MAGAIETGSDPAPLDTTVLGTYYLFASIDDLKVAIKALEFEVEHREAREKVGAAIRARHAKLAEEIGQEIDRIDQQFESVP